MPKEREEPPEDVELRDLESKLVADFPEDEYELADEQRFKQLLYHLADYYRREDKPRWWQIFSCQSMTDEELLEDPECLGMLTMDKSFPPYQEKRSLVYTYTFPEQEYKIREGDQCLDVRTLQPCGVLTLDEDARVIRLKRSENREPLPEQLSLSPPWPISSQKLREALRSVIWSYVCHAKPEEEKYTCIFDVLRKRVPRLNGIPPGGKLPVDDDSGLDDYLGLVLSMVNTYLFIQGPPGTGKTYTGSRLIVELMRKGYKVGVTANAHKAINNLLSKVEEYSAEIGFRFAGIKKSNSQDSESLCRGELIRDVFSDKEVTGALSNHQLVAGTAWLFANDRLDNSLDFLVMDEAGQISLAKFVSTAKSCKNVILLGDPMQLPQPSQGIHPGESGKSVLEYLLGSRHTIPETEGLLLSTTYRMHPKVCGFISDAFYDSRIRSDSDLVRQLISGDGGEKQDLPEAGIVCRLIEHEGRSQQSEEEAEYIAKAYHSLIGKTFCARDGKRRRIGVEDILVVAPYNMQVNLLKHVLGPGARVGTVDKFQGQEALVVFVSMTTSSREDMPRRMDFLYSPNRLNVALSRARCLSVLVVSANLFNARCTTVDQMRLVNTLCWAKEYSENQDPTNQSMMRS